MPIGDSLDPEYDYVVHMQGSATTLPPEEEDERIVALHKIVAEVTGKPVEVPKRQRIGFLP